MVQRTKGAGLEAVRGLWSGVHTLFVFVCMVMSYEGLLFHNISKDVQFVILMLCTSWDVFDERKLQKSDNIVEE
jgi:hypothetical protein